MRSDVMASRGEEQIKGEELDMIIAEGEGLRTEFKERYRKEIDRDME